MRGCLVRAARTILTVSFVLQPLIPGVEAAELEPGDVLSTENWQLARDLLPLEVLKF